MPVSQCHCPTQVPNNMATPQHIFLPPEANTRHCNLGEPLETFDPVSLACIAVSTPKGAFPYYNKTNYMHHQNAGRIQSVRIDNSTFERVEKFKYLGTTLTNKSSIPEEIKSRLRSGNSCYHSVQNLLSSRLLSNNLKIKISTIFYL